MDNLICCTPRVDRFLAVTKTKPLESMRLVKTVKQRQEQERQMVECLDHVKEIELDI